MNFLSVVIITLNEERNIGRCIDSVKTVADEIIILDSFSTDRTVEIAIGKGAIVKQQTFSRYVEQKNRALQLATHDYVLSLDADEALSNELAASVLKAKQHFRFGGYTMKRSNFFCDRFIRHGLWYPDRKLRLFNKQFAQWGGYDPHDKVILDENIAVKQLDGDLLHYAYYSMEAYLQKNEKVSAIAARSLYENGIKKHWLKLYFSPAWEFLNGYILRLGFLDGHAGFIIAVHSANQSFLKHQLLQRLQKQSETNIAWNNITVK